MYYEMLQNMVGSGMTKNAGMEKQALTLQQLTRMYLRAQAKGPQAAARFEELLAKRNAAIPKVRGSRDALERELWKTNNAAKTAHDGRLIDDATRYTISNRWVSSSRRRIPKGEDVFPYLNDIPAKDRIGAYDFMFRQSPAINARNLNRLLNDGPLQTPKGSLKEPKRFFSKLFG